MTTTNIEDRRRSNLVTFYNVQRGHYFIYNGILHQSINDVKYRNGRASAVIVLTGEVVNLPSIETLVERIPSVTITLFGDK